MNTKMDRGKNAATTSGNLREKDALAFLDFTKRKLKDAEEHSKLLKLMIHRMDMNQVSTELINILEDLQQVVVRFNQEDIRPATDITDYHNHNNDNDDRPQLTQNDAVEFIISVKHRFVDDPSKFKNMIQLLSDWRNSIIDIQQLIVAVRKLLEGHNDLLEKFYKFMPKEFVGRR